MLKRAMDVVLALLGLLVSSIVLVPAAIAIWLQDFHSPFYIAPRIGRDAVPFRMVKLRSMIVNADRSGVDSTSAKDQRITPVGHFIRSYKLDELSQLWNVLLGDMSLVGPRPNVQCETACYTVQEQRLLTVRPGITDLASIVFSDLNTILADSRDPDLDYNQLVRPWKSRLGLVYIDHQSLWLDVRLIALTALAIVSRPRALAGVQRILVELNVAEDVRRVARRTERLVPHPPPGASEIVTDRTRVPR
jgi:lipopolysaccharide/colanic/teichoic acid biosynthesis glycosyltransferase